MPINKDQEADLTPEDKLLHNREQIGDEQEIDREQQVGSTNGDEITGPNQQEELQALNSIAEHLHIDEGESVGERLPKQKRHDIAKEQHELRQIGAIFDRPSIGTVIIGNAEHGSQPDQNFDESMHYAGLKIEEMTLVASVYVKTNTYDAVYKCFSDKRWVILRGQPNTGKRSTALNLAYELRRGVPELHELSPQTNLKEWITGKYISENRFYFVDSLAGERAQDLHNFEGLKMEEVLREKNSYLVITVKNSVNFADGFPNEMVHTWKPPSNRRKLLENHLLHYKVPLETIKIILNESEVIEILERQLLPTQVKQLAQHLCKYDLPDDLVVALNGFNIYTDDILHRQFSTATNDSERAFRIALSVFSGARYRSVEVAADRLADLMKKSASTNTIEQANIVQSLFDDADWIERARAKTVIEYPTDDSLIPIEIIRLDDPAYQPALLGYLWKRFGKLRPILLAWLREYGSNQYRDMRMRASMAVAFLAQKEYETVISQVLVPWADERNRRSRQSLAYTFGSLVNAEAYSSASLALIRRWAQKDRIELAWAAARSYAVIGPYYPREAMDCWLEILMRFNFIERYILESLRVIVDDELKPLFDSLFDAIYTFFIYSLTLHKDEFIRIYKQIVASLRDWVDFNNRRSFSILIGIPLFVELMDLRIVEDEVLEDNENEDVELDSAPALLVLADSCEPDDQVFHDLAWLLSIAIRTPETRKLVINTSLYNWVAYVDNYDELLTALEAVLRTLVNNDSFNRYRWRREIGRKLENWAKDSRKPVPIADRLVRNLKLQQQY